jgi:hypothetical protein
MRSDAFTFVCVPPANVWRVTAAADEWFTSLVPAMRASQIGSQKGV